MAAPDPRPFAHPGPRASPDAPLGDYYARRTPGRHDQCAVQAIHPQCEARGSLQERRSPAPRTGRGAEVFRIPGRQSPDLGTAAVTKRVPILRALEIAP